MRRRPPISTLSNPPFPSTTPCRSDLGPAVNIQAMVFGNRGAGSGSGVAFTRDPASGAPGVYGDYLTNAQGEDVVAGICNTVPLAELEQIDAASYGQLMEIMATLAKHYRDLCDIEFIIERSEEHTSELQSLMR